MELHDINKVEHLFFKYYKVLRAYAFKYVNDMEAAEDIVQDVFMGVWENRDHIDDSVRTKSYLFRSVYNRSINYLSCKRISSGESLDKFIEQMNRSTCNDADQENIFMAKELKEVVNQFIMSLPPQRSKIFEMSRVRNMKIKEIADIMNLSPKTIEKYLYKSIEDLKRYLRDYGLLGALLLFYLHEKYFL